MLDQEIIDIEQKAKAAFLNAQNRSSLYDQKVKFLGKNGQLTAIMKKLGQVPAPDKPKYGQIINKVKSELEALYSECEKKLKNQETQETLKKEALDMTLPGPVISKGSLHPITLTIREIVSILSRIGFSVRTGPLIESDLNNFERLNIPADHPSREMQDTFYVQSPKGHEKSSYVLRTHTSPVQARTMMTEKPPIRILAPGSVFRCDSDISHSPHFHQIEGLLIDKKVSMAALKGTISFFVKNLFGDKTQVRFRPSFFPFTEPSAEVDCTCPICTGRGCRMCKDSGWIEIGGCGLVNPKVLEACGVNNQEWQGYAFGFGIERMAIIKYGINDIRLFTENDLRFLNQF